MTKTKQPKLLLPVIFTVLISTLAVSGQQASALSVDLIETPDNPITDILSTLMAPASGITIVSGSETFVGRVGDGIDANTAQSATYTGLNLTPNNVGFPTITNPDGIFLTSGVANIPQTNGDTSFDSASVGTAHPGTGGDTDLSAILTAASAPSSTVNDVNFIQFDFTTDPTNTSVEADFVFASDEFPDQGVTDVFAFIVDGQNYAFFSDGSLVSFVLGQNAANFVDNNVGTNNYNIEYDGISIRLHVVGLLDPALTTHTIKIAIADTSDSIYDSGVFIGNLKAGTGDDGGIPDPVNEPPIANDDVSMTDEGNSVTINVLSNDTDPNDDVLEITAVTQGSDGTVSFTSSTVTYTPTDPDFNGIDTFTYTITDGEFTDDATVTVTVKPVNDPPEAEDDISMTNEDESVTIDVLSNDTDPDGDVLSISGVTDGTHGTVTTDGNVLTYTPNADFFDGTDTFTYTVTDTGLTDEATVTVIVNPLANTSGKVTAGGAQFDEGTNFGFNVQSKNGESFKGQLQYNDRNTDIKLHSTSMTALSVSEDETSATFKGTAKVNGQSGFTFKVTVEDNGEPSIDDFFRIVIKDSSGNTVYLEEGTLRKGNIQIH